MSVLLAGRFDVKEKIGEGTFAEVWRAMDKEAGVEAKSVALKIFRPSAEGDRDFSWDPVFREIDAGLRMTPHPNVLRTWALTNVRFFSETETPCLVMDYVQGTNLALWLAGEEPPGLNNLEARLAVMGGLLRGIAHAHSSGVVHHDVSFGNALIRASNPPQALLADFGCSQTQAWDSDADPEEHGPLEIQPINPPPYGCHHSFGEGARRDVYGFGTLCYLALTGRHPLSDDWQSMRTGQWTGSPSPHCTLPRRAMTELCPWILQESRMVALSDLLLRCVSADPCLRPESAITADAEWEAIIGAPD